VDIALEPIVVTLGPLTIRWLGLFWLAGALVAAAYWIGEVDRAGSGQISREQALDLLAWVAPAALVGARLFHVLSAGDHYALNLLEAVRPAVSGLSLWGALIGGGAFGAVAARAHRLDLAHLAGAAAPALALGEAVGRIGCLIDGSNAGTVTDLSWGVRYVHDEAQAPDRVFFRHPAPLYHAVAALVTFGLVRRAAARSWSPGAVFALWLALHATGRLGIGLVRLDPPLLLGLQQAQWCAIVALAALGFAMIRRWRGRTAAPAACH
jgi:phosphatidylglycerol:prolipoprotein diacylglycerol transferase